MVVATAAVQVLFVGGPVGERHHMIEVPVQHSSSADGASAVDVSGADVVGMTGMPEAALARELELPYAALCVVANHAAGKGSSRTTISLEGIRRVLDGAMESVRAVLEEAVR